jgi:lysophospholipid acyltransferase (LPLAT)-like uncharacterized protein
LRAPRLDRALKRLRGSAAGRWALSRLGAAYVRLCWATTRWRVEGREHADALLATGAPVIAAFWHGRLLFSPFWIPRDRPVYAMISNNHDGALIAALVARFGVVGVRGSSAHPGKRDADKGGRAAFAAGAAALRGGGVLGITPDGPRGPRMRAHPGVAALSVAAGAAVLPVAFSTRRGRLSRSWDRFLVARPFDDGVLLYGAPLPPPADAAGVEAHRLAVETALNALTERADRMAGREPARPDPAPVPA